MLGLHLYMFGKSPHGEKIHTFLMRLFLAFLKLGLRSSCIEFSPLCCSLCVWLACMPKTCIFVYMFLLAFVAYKEQHVSMCRMYIGMVGQSSKGGWFLIILMTLSSSLTAVWVKHTLSWGLPSCWFSLLMVSLYAQMLGTLCSNICWHLAFLQNGWDEVNGQYPLVYEDAISETSYFVLMILTYDTCRLVWHFDTGIRTSHCLHDQWPESTIGAYGRVLGTQSSLMVQGPLTLIFHLRMYCSPMNVLERIQCRKDDALIFIFGCAISLAISCNHCFVSDVEQHLSVLGPYLLALDLHLRVLGQVYSGSYYSYCFFLASAVVMVSLSAKFILNCTVKPSFDPIIGLDFCSFYVKFSRVRVKLSSFLVIVPKTRLFFISG